ncbi:MAG: hypothetical protein DYG89_20635 [Caldilinea sp. CFX5]|nr:hypothetical protein [Caldilinea sp. CFX5]
MTVSRQPQITEELLSAYLDEQVTAEERALVEAAMATDPAIAWQVDSLRQTVHLLQTLPPLALPRSLSLEAILAEARAAETPAPFQAEAVKTSAPHQPVKRTVVKTPTIEEPETSWWQWFLQLWQGGNLQLRNAAAVALTLFFVLFAGDRFLVSTRPLVEVTPNAAPVVLTSSAASSEGVAVEAPAPLAVEPTATTVAATMVAATTNNSDQPPSEAAENAEVNPLANTAAQPETGTFQAEGATLAAPMGAPGPREEDLTGGGSAGDAPATEGFRTAESGDRGLAAKSTAPMAAVAANNPVTQEAIAAEPPLTTAAAVSVSAVVTTADVITLTTPATLPLTVAPTATVDSATPLASGAPTIDEPAAWLTWAQIITALSTVVLAGLWWRSRR